MAAGQWQVICHCGSSRDAYQFDFVQLSLAVRAYVFVSTLYDGGIRAAFYNANGALACDFSRPNPLFPRASGVANGAPMTVQLLIRPVVMGCPTSDPSAGTNRWRTEFIGACGAARPIPSLSALPLDLFHQPLT